MYLSGESDTWECLFKKIKSVKNSNCVHYFIIKSTLMNHCDIILVIDGFIFIIIVCSFLLLYSKTN